MTVCTVMKYVGWQDKWGVLAPSAFWSSPATAEWENIKQMAFTALWMWTVWREEIKGTSDCCRLVEGELSVVTVRV